MQVVDTSGEKIENHLIKTLFTESSVDIVEDRKLLGSKEAIEEVSLKDSLKQKFGRKPSSNIEIQQARKDLSFQSTKMIQVRNQF